MKRTPIQKRVLTWPEVTLLLAQDQSKTWIPPKFPTRRWGNIYTLTSTTDKLTVEHLVTQLQNLGYQAKKKRDKEKTLQHKNLGIFYRDPGTNTHIYRSGLTLFYYGVPHQADSITKQLE